MRKLGFRTIILKPANTIDCWNGMREDLKTRLFWESFPTLFQYVWYIVMIWAFQITFLTLKTIIFVLTDITEHK